MCDHGRLKTSSRVQAKDLGTPLQHSVPKLATLRLQRNPRRWVHPWGSAPQPTTLDVRRAQRNVQKTRGSETDHAELHPRTPTQKNGIYFETRSTQPPSLHTSDLAYPMVEPTPPSPAPQQARTRYTALRTAALAFVTAQSHNPSLPEGINTAALRALVTPTYTHAFGPSHFVSLTPKLQGAFGIDGFIAHLRGMVPALERWEVRVEGVCVDEVEESVVVRVGYVMWVKGAGEGEGVRNEGVWWLGMEETGEGWRVGRSREVVDGVAAGRIGELVRGVLGEGEGRGGAVGVE